MGFRRPCRQRHHRRIPQRAHHRHHEGRPTSETVRSSACACARCRTSTVGRLSHMTRRSTPVETGKLLDLALEGSRRRLRRRRPCGRRWRAVLAPAENVPGVWPRRAPRSMSTCNQCTEPDWPYGARRRRQRPPSLRKEKVRESNPLSSTKPAGPRLWADPEAGERHRSASCPKCLPRRLRAVVHRSVPSRRLGAVQRQVGALDDLFQVQRWVELGYTEAHRRKHRVAEL